ncbi:hypothetical protein [uncultured Roseibium sp.]|uniref:hypothetical protein n=1 Tax=uncultured Roseibium sp. TaxID=1936171 RepID=UPI0026094EB8|nr:hypothetical protein [uncultured Roseibium sp.]
MKILAGRRATGRIAAAILIATGTLTGTLAAQAQSEQVAKPSQSFLQALNTLDSAWNASELAFTTVSFSEDASTGYGKYTPLDAAKFADGDTINVYAEPVGYGFQESADGYAYELTASYRLLNLSGQVLAEQSNFASFSGNSRSKKRELSAALSFQFSGLPAGDYQLETSFSDEFGGKKAAFNLPFTVVEAN